MRGLTLGVLLGLVMGCAAPEAPFEDVTATAGLGGPVPSYDAALADFDGDGLVDVFVGNHGEEPALYRNLGGGRFEDVHTAAGVTPRGDPHGAGWGDESGDGRPDLYVGFGAGRGHVEKANRLYRNAGGGRFTEVGAPAGVGDPAGRARTVAWVDYDRDGRLDLFVGNYASPNVLLHNEGDGTFADRAPLAGLARPPAWRAVWTDYDRDGAPDVLLTATPRGLRLMRNRGDGTFEDTTDAAGIARQPPAQGAAFADADGDGDLDLVIASGSDFPPGASVRGGTLTLASIQGGADVGLTFAGTQAELELALWIDGKPVRGSAARARVPLADATPFTARAADVRSDGPPPAAGTGVLLWVDRDGRWQLRWRGTKRLHGRIGPGVTAVEAVGFRPWRAHRPHRLYLNQGDGRFVEGAARAGITTRGNGQGVAWGDVENDGDLDLWVVHSGVEGADEADTLYLNDGRGRFTAAGGLVPGEGRGCGANFADFDADGRLDLVLTTGWGVQHLAGGRHRVLRNVAPAAHWLEVELVGRASNHPGLGSWIEIEVEGRRLTRYRAGGGLYSQSLVPEHFGLGRAAQARVEVTWPSGLVSSLETAADRRLRIVEPEAPGE